MPWDGVPERWLYGGVLLLTAFALGSTLTFGFVYDDHWTLLGNGFLRDLGNLPMLLGPKAAEAGDGPGSGEGHAFDCRAGATVRVRRLLDGLGGHID